MVHKKGLFLLAYCMQIYSMEIVHTNHKREKVASLKYLASKKVWDHQQLFFTWKQDYIEWKAISPDVYLDILHHGVTTPEMIMNVLKNAQSYATQDFIKHITENILLHEPTKFIEALEHKEFSVNREGYLKSLMIGILAKKHIVTLPEIKICPQSRNVQHLFKDQLNMLLLNPQRHTPFFEHTHFTVQVTDDFRVQKTYKKNQKKEYYSGHTGQIITVTCNKEGTCAVTGDVYGAVWYWNFAQGVGKNIGQHLGPVCGIKIDNFLIASFGTDKIVRLYSLLTNSVVKIEGFKQSIMRINFDRKKPILYVNFNDDSVKVWYPEQYVSGAFSPEQLLILGVIKRLQEGHTLDKQALAVFKNVLKKYPFELPVQKYFEKEHIVFEQK